MRCPAPSEVPGNQPTLFASSGSSAKDTNQFALNYVPQVEADQGQSQNDLAATSSVTTCPNSPLALKEHPSSISGLERRVEVPSGPTEAAIIPELSSAFTADGGPLTDLPTRHLKVCSLPWPIQGQ